MEPSFPLTLKNFKKLRNFKKLKINNS